MAIRAADEKVMMGALQPALDRRPDGSNPLVEKPLADSAQYVRIDARALAILELFEKRLVRSRQSRVGGDVQLDRTGDRLTIFQPSGLPDAFFLVEPPIEREGRHLKDPP